METRAYSPEQRARINKVRDWLAEVWRERCQGNATAGAVERPPLHHKEEKEERMPVAPLV